MYTMIRNSGSANADILNQMTLESSEHTRKTKTARVSSFLGDISWVGQLNLISDSHIKFQQSQNRLSDHKGPENINYTIVKYWEHITRPHSCNTDWR